MVIPLSKDVVNCMQLECWLCTAALSEQERLRRLKCCCLYDVPNLSISQPNACSQKRHLTRHCK